MDIAQWNLLAEEILKLGIRCPLSKFKFAKYIARYYNYYSSYNSLKVPSRLNENFIVNIIIERRCYWSYQKFCCLLRACSLISFFWVEANKQPFLLHHHDSNKTINCTTLLSSITLELLDERFWIQRGLHIHCLASFLISKIRTVIIMFTNFWTNLYFKNPWYTKLLASQAQSCTLSLPDLKNQLQPSEGYNLKQNLLYKKIPT